MRIALRGDHGKMVRQHREPASPAEIQKPRARSRHDENRQRKPVGGRPPRRTTSRATAPMAPPMAIVASIGQQDWSARAPSQPRTTTPPPIPCAPSRLRRRPRIPIDPARDETSTANVNGCHTKAPRRKEQPPTRHVRPLYGRVRPVLRPPTLPNPSKPARPRTAAVAECLLDALINLNRLDSESTVNAR
jgi:hypothetical protein